VIESTSNEAFRRAGICLMVAVIALSVGCGKEEIQVYRVPKEKPPMRVDDGHDHPPAVMPSLAWKLPPGWEERGPGRMSIASFSIPGKAGQEAEVSVMPMPGESASNLSLLVNIVRQGAGMGPIGDEELARLVEDISIGGLAARLVDLSGATASNGPDKESRIILAVLTRAGTTWLFKMAGSADLVSSQKGTFLDFLKSITFHEVDAQPPATANVRRGAAAADESVTAVQAKPKWEVPQGWKEVPPTQMLLAKFLLTGPADSKAEVTVSVFPGDVGGLVANVNRWRRQIGLAEAAADDVSKLVSALDVARGKAMLVDMSGSDAKKGQKTRLIGVIVPQGAQTWFYKLMGDEAVAEREKAAFIRFVQGAKHPDAV
jgi:hypothetical protein